MSSEVLVCVDCESEVEIDELVPAEDVEPLSINDYVHCPQCGCMDFDIIDVEDEG